MAAGKVAALGLGPVAVNVMPKFPSMLRADENDVKRSMPKRHAKNVAKKTSKR